MNHLFFSFLCDDGAVDDFAGAFLMYKNATAELVAAISFAKNAEDEAIKAAEKVQRTRLLITLSLCKVEEALVKMENACPGLAQLCQGEEAQLPAKHLTNVPLDATERAFMDAAEAEGLICYSQTTHTYDAAPGVTRQLVAYLAGRIFAGDYCEKSTMSRGGGIFYTWKAGRTFPASKVNKLFAFNVGNAHKQFAHLGNKPPKQHERVDKLFGLNSSSWTQK